MLYIYAGVCQLSQRAKVVSTGVTTCLRLCHTPI
nr:MAG TPA: hypothetical protein [Caudoviricetes sp.]